jgi:hypothetical protein
MLKAQDLLRSVLARGEPLSKCVVAFHSTSDKESDLTSSVAQETVSTEHECPKQGWYNSGVDMQSEMKWVVGRSGKN